MPTLLVRNADILVTMDDERREFLNSALGLGSGYRMRMLTMVLWTAAKEDLPGEPEHHH